MIDIEKLDRKLDIRKISETHSDTTESKDDNKIKNPYAEKYMKDKKRVVLKDGVTDNIRNIKRKRNFASDNDTVKFLCDLESELSRKRMIQEFAKCPDCGQTMSIDHIRKVHQHVDKNAECYGCLERSYKIQSEATDTERLKDEQNEQTDTIEEKKKVLDGVNYWDDNSNDIGEWSQEKRSLWADGKI